MGGNNRAGKKREWVHTFQKQKWAGWGRSWGLGWRKLSKLMLRSYIMMMWAVIGLLMATNIGF